jgi:hypothetical protein
MPAIFFFRQRLKSTTWIDLSCAYFLFCEASVRFNFPPLKMSLKKNLTTQQAVGGRLGGWVGGWGRETTQKKKKESLLEDSWVHKSRGCKQVSRSDTSGGHLNISQKQKRDPMLLTS